MADQKISELTALTGANVADDDAIAIVDTSATETKKIVFSELKNALDTATGFVRITGDTMTGNLSMGDNVKAIFGANDLQIYHDGSHSYIKDVGTGNFELSSNGDGFYFRDGSNNYLLTLSNGGPAQLWHNGSQKLATTSTGVDIVGTLTSDGLTVSGDAVFTPDNDGVRITGANYATLRLEENDTSNVNTSIFNSGGDFVITTSSDDRSSTTDRIRLDHATGDISFYEDTGTTAKFFWDASAEKLGIGTSSPAAMLDLRHNSASTHLRLTENTSGNWSAFGVDTSDNLRIYVNTSEAMRIDNSGNLLVGKTASDYSTTGTQLSSNGQVTFTSDGNTTLQINRKTSDGVIQRFSKDGSAVGSIGTATNELEIKTSGTRYLELQEIVALYNSAWTGNLQMSPTVSSVDLGNTNNQWDNLFLSGSIEIENGTGNVGVGKTALNSNIGANNTAIGFEAGYSNSTGVENTYLGRNAGYYVTSGNKNTIVGAYAGNQGGLDIRTSSNNIVLSDGDGNPRLYIDSAGDCKIGGGNTSKGYQAVGLTAFANGETTLVRDGSPPVTVTRKGNAGHAIDFYNTTNFSGYINVNGTTTSYATSSDYRLKENVVDLTGATDRLKQLEPKRFNFIADADTTVDGFLAHEVQDIVPEAIGGTKDEVDADGNPVYQGIDQSKLVPLLVATIKELEARITALENA